MSSLPVPVSPRMSTVESIRATDQARGTPGPRQLSCKACRAVHIQNSHRNRCFEKKPASVRQIRKTLCHESKTNMKSLREMLHERTEKFRASYRRRFPSQISWLLRRLVSRLRG